MDCRDGSGVAGLVGLSTDVNGMDWSGTAGQAGLATARLGRARQGMAGKAGFGTAGRGLTRRYTRRRLLFAFRLAAERFLGGLARVMKSGTIGRLGAAPRPVSAVVGAVEHERNAHTCSAQPAYPLPEV